MTRLLFVLVVLLFLLVYKMMDEISDVNDRISNLADQQIVVLQLLQARNKR